MEIEGSLEAMNLPSLVQFVVQEGSQALIELDAGNRSGRLYLADGQMYHAEFHDPDTTDLVGEEAVYQMLGLHSGNFKVKKKVTSPTESIQQSWDYILMEGLRQVDESHAPTIEETNEDSLEELISNLSETDAAAIKELAALQQKDSIDMANVEKTLEAVMGIDGALAAALVDWESGLTLGTIGSGMNIDLAAAGNTNVVRSKLSVMKDLKLKGGIEDILITLTEQYHIIRLLDDNPNLFLYLALKREGGNLGMARHKLSTLEKELDV